MNNSAIHSNIVNNIFLQNEEFVLFGLTGRVRSGQDDVVDILTSHKLDKLRSTSALGGKHNNDAERENNIILRYLLHHWRPFIRIHVSAIMMSFLLEACSAEDNNIILDIFKNVCCNIFKDEKSINRPGYINIFNNFSESLSLMIHLTESQTKDVNSKFVSNLQKELEELIKILTENDKYLVNMITFWKKNFYKALTSNSIDPKLLIFCFVILPYILECFKISIDENKNDIDYIVSMQKIGNSLRAHGKPFCFNEDEIEKCIDGKNIFCIALRVNNIIKILRNTNYNNIDANFEKNKVLILIDDFKNVYEILFFRKRYSAFYLLSISTDDESRRKNFNYDEKLYQTSSLNETPNVGQKKYEIFINAYLSYANDKENINNANINNVNIDNNNDNFENNFNDKKLHVKCKLYGLTEYEIQFCMQAYKDKLRRHCYLYNLHSFILQDIIPCVENADIFINNNYHKEYNTKHSPRDVGGYKLCLDILRYVTLV